MPSVVIPNTYSLAIDWAFGGSIRMTNVLHYRVASPQTVTQAYANSVAGAVGAAFISSNWEDEVATSIGLEHVRVRSLHTANQPEWTGVINDDGLNAGTLMPLQNAVCVTLRTDLAGRRYRGRTYLGGLTEAANGTDGAIGTTTRTRAADFITAIENNLISGALGNTLVVASRTYGTAQDVTSILVRDGQWDTQRRRSHL